ncbi:MAG: hypothetical protein KAQ83_04215 [Nanoarchaeota archaeon]|nr:hypothetical protein [Nanoarchaeota archaeon]
MSETQEELEFRILVKHLPTLTLAGAASRGEHELRPFLKYIASISNRDEFLGNLVGGRYLHKRIHNPANPTTILNMCTDTPTTKIGKNKPATIYDIIKVAQGIAREHKIGWYSAVQKLLAKEEFKEFQKDYSLPHEKYEQETRINKITNPEVLKTLIDCLKIAPPKYTSNIDDISDMRLGGYSGIIEFEKFIPDTKDKIKQRNAYIISLQERLRNYDISSSDTSKLIITPEDEEFRLT